MINGPVTHDVVRVGTVGCRALCVSSVMDLVRPSTSLTTVRGGKSYRFQIAHDVRADEKIAKRDDRCWL